MTIGFYPEKKWASRLKKLFKDELNEEAQKYFEQIYGELCNNQAFRMAARLVRSHSKANLEFRKLLNISMAESGLMLTDEMLKGQPLMVLGKDPTTIRVYPNIILDEIGAEELQYCSCLLHSQVLNTFLKDYKEAIASPTQRVGWTPLSRAWKRIKKYEEIGTAKAITRYTKVQKIAACSDSSVRNIAQGIDEQRKPLELIWVEKIPQSWDMYATGPTSCMDPRTHGASLAWDKILQPTGHHPTSFYWYHPYIQGVYTKKMGKVAARTFVYEYENGKKQYGRVYSSDEKSKEKFTSALEKLGITWMGDNKSSSTRLYNREVEFDIPGIKYDNVYYMPIPYCDNITNSINVTFDASSKMFKVHMGGSTKANVPSQGQSGLINNTMLSNVPCRVCGRVADRNVININGKIFCRAECAKAEGYCYAVRSDGIYVWVAGEDVYSDPWTGTVYTNKAACEARGGLPMLNDLDDLDENEDITTQGPIVMRDDKLYRLNSSDIIYKITNYIREGLLKQASMDCQWGAYYILQAPKSLLKINIHQQRCVEIDDEANLIAA